jgi:hypothetical protein
MKFLLTVVAVSFLLASAHQSTAPPHQTDYLQTAYINQVDTVTSQVSWVKVLNLDTSFADVVYVAQLEVMTSPDFGVLSKAADLKREVSSGSLSAYTVPPRYLYRGYACADARATFEDA